MIIPFPRLKRKARIEIIPLIDIVFFLLATFVMLSLSMVKNLGVDVNLPSATTSSKQVNSNQYTSITVTDKGEIYFNKEKISAAELPVRLGQLKKINNDPTIVLNGDEKASYGRAIFVLDEARRIGIKKIALETKQP